MRENHLWNRAKTVKIQKTPYLPDGFTVRFADLYAALPLEKCGYLPEEVATASPKDMEAYYTPAQQAEHGVLGIEIQVI